MCEGYQKGNDITDKTCQALPFFIGVRVMMQAFKTEEIEVNGNTIYYEQYGQASSRETIVLLHGFLSSSFSFRRLIPFLQEDFNVISIDLPPFGKSGKSDRYIYSYKNTAQTVMQFLEKLGLDKVTIAGHSMGGQISLNVAHQYPGIIKKAILLCSSSYLPKLKMPLVLSSYLPYFHLYVKLYLQRSGVRQNLRNVVHDHSMITDEMMYGYLAPFLEDDIFKALTRMIRHREGDLDEKALKGIDTPCLLIWGEHDRVVPLSIGKRLDSDLPNSRLIVLKDTGHLVPEERPEEVYSHMKAFICAK